MRIKLIVTVVTIGSLHVLSTSGSNFGKTHFIVGYESKTLPTIVEPSPIPTIVTLTTDRPFNLIHDNKINAVFFSPDDNVHTILEYLIEQEKKQILLAMFAFTDKKIAQVLVDAQKRGVRVEVITDASSVYGKYNKLSVLHDGKVGLYVYNPERAKTAMQGLMHNKFFLFKDNIFGKSLVWTGSFNVTVAAGKANRENVLVSEEKLYVEKFTQEFEQLKKYCDRYQKPIPAISHK
jgi:phosphatidylserine/phosphatidylglycerophosphate/cardiolipin synthase-like enzyme